MTAPSTDQETRERVRSIIVEVAPTKVATDDGQDVTALNLAADLGYHSLALLEAIVAIEEELGIALVDDGSAMFISTVGELEDYVVKLGQTGLTDPT
jgi:acyl carrier protein